MMKKKIAARLLSLTLALLLMTAGVVTAGAAGTVQTQVNLKVTAPSDGMTSETAPEVTASDNDCSLEWAGWSTAEGYEPEGTITFAEGQTYYFLAKIKAADGYDFYYNTEAEVAFTGEGKVEKTVSVVNDDQTGYSSITYLISVVAREARFKGMINDVVLNVTPPMQGQSSAAAPKVTVPENMGFSVSAAEWCDESGNALQAPVQFAGGSKYYVHVGLTADDGCWWNQLGTLQLTVNGGTLKGNFNAVNSTEGCWADAVLEVVAESAPENVVPYVQLGFNAPASGTEVTFDHESYKIKATPAADTFITLPGNVDYTYSGYWSALWCDSTGEDTVQDDFTVYGGMTYYIEVLLKATNGKHFDLRYTAVSVDNASVLSTELESGMLYMVFAFTPGKGEGDLSVCFDPNGGAGELPTIYLPAGRSCQLPACSFTKAERIFAAWEVNGEKKNPNDTITVTADTVVKAIWRHTKIVDVVNTVDTSTTEVVGTLVLTDSRTGEETSIEVSRGTAASGFSNPQSDDVNALIETAKAAIRTEAAKYGIAADTDSLEPDVSVVDTTDKRTLEFESDMTDENGDLYAAFIIKGDFGHVWRMTFTLTVEKTAPSVLIGDVNNDGNINIFDVTAIQRHLAEMELLSGGGLKAADCTGDGKVSIDDATRLQMYLAEYDVTLG